MSLTNNADFNAASRNSHQRGGANAKVVLVEYGDFQCPTCKQAAPAVDLLLQTHGAKLRFVFRHFPLEQIHPEALFAAEAAESAGAQSRFWEMHAALFANQSHLSMADLERLAAKIDLDVARFLTDMRSHAHLARVRADIASGQEAGVRSTPGFFLNGKVQDVSFGMHALRDAVEAAVAR